MPSTKHSVQNQSIVNGPAAPLGAPADAGPAEERPVAIARIQEWVEERPWPAVSAATGAGIVLGLLGHRAPVQAVARSAFASLFGIAARILLVAVVERVVERRRPSQSFH